MFFYLYTALSILFYLAALPFLILFSFKEKYKVSIPARFWRYRNPPLSPDGVWIHVCSFGEARAVAPLVRALPRESVRMSTTTQTGKSVIDEYTVQSRYLPFEPLLFGWVRPQKALVVMEAELWYLLFVLAKRKGAVTMLINARISDRSFERYVRFAFFYKRLFAHVDYVFAQSERDKERLARLGAKHIEVTGNIKLADLPRPSRGLEKPEGFVVCAASTHEGEEAVILEAFASLKAQKPDAILWLVPRHPERFESVATEAARFGATRGMRTVRYSEKGRLSDADIVVVDTMGMLVDLYAMSDVVILGGSFVPVGGHNAAEAAQFGCRILSGPHIFNQKEIYGAIEGIRIVEKEELGEALCRYDTLVPTRLREHSDIQRITEVLNRVLRD